jgi:hypothetical protein
MASPAGGLDLVVGWCTSQKSQSPFRLTVPAAPFQVHVSPSLTPTPIAE